VSSGGTYVGLGAGGALLAGKGFLGISAAESVPANVGLGLVQLRLVRPSSPLWFGYDPEQPLTAFFFGPPGSSGGWPPGSPDGGFAFAATDAAVALYDGVDEFPDELSFITTEPLEASSGNAAIVQDRHGQGQIVLIGLAPTFRGEWKHTFRLLYNALYLSSDSS
jgi:hypothetical protein